MTGGDEDAQLVQVYHEGDEVIAWLPSREQGPQAFLTKWKGPFVVMRRMGLKTYRLRNTSSGRDFTANVDNLHHYRRRPKVLQATHAGPDDGGRGERASVGPHYRPDLGRTPVRPVSRVDLGRTPVRPDSGTPVDDDVTLASQAQDHPRDKQRAAEELETSIDESTPSPVVKAEIDSKPRGGDHQVLYACPDTGRWKAAKVMSGDVADEHWVLELQPDGALVSAEAMDEVADFDAALVGELWQDGDLRTDPGAEALDAEVLDVAEPEETPFAELSHLERARVTKEVIAVLNEFNQQLEVRRSTIPGLARAASYGVFARKRLRKALVIGTYRGETYGKGEYDMRYPSGHPRYVLEVKRNVFVDASDPTKAGVARFINDPGPGRKPNVAFVFSRGKCLVQTLRLILPKEEIFVSYGPEFYCAQDERKSAPTDKDSRALAEAGGVPLEDMRHPRGAPPTPEPSPPPTMAKLLSSGHRDFEADSLVLYSGENGVGWLVGSIVSVDVVRPLIEIHRYGSFDLRTGKTLPLCRFYPVYFDPKDNKQVYTKKPVRRYNPVFDIIEFSDVMERDFHLTNRSRLPDHVVRRIETLAQVLGPPEGG